MAKAQDIEKGTQAKIMEQAMKGGIVVAIVAYALCSSSMLLINKVAVHSLPAPSFVLMCQLASASVVAYVLGKGGLVVVDSLEIAKAKAFLPAALSFLGVIYTNIKVGQERHHVHANIATGYGKCALVRVFVDGVIVRCCDALDAWSKLCMMWCLLGVVMDTQMHNGLLEMWEDVLGAFFTVCVVWMKQVIQYANLETFIVFRCSTPLIMSVSDYLFLNRELPTIRSWACLVAILFSAAGYVASDSDFQVEAYLWIVAWYGIFVFEMTYLKHLCDTVEMTSWGRVFYNNFMALFPLFLIGLASQEGNTVSNVVWNTEAIGSLVLSCLVGIGMSFTSFWLRSLVSATAFTVIGIMCKIGSVVLNYLYWDKHASAIGIGFLSIR